jgi:CTP:molybdopterin cytidylyltransferase MocA
MPSAVVPAAGSASRFGGGKLFAPIDGVPLLDRTLGALLDAGIEEVVVVAPPESGWGDGVARLGDPRVRTAVNPDPSRGMFSSIQVGLRAVGGSPVAVIPGDMPFVKAGTVRALLHLPAAAGAIVSPRFHGRRGHPVLLPADLLETIRSAPATAMLNEVLRPYAGRFVDLDVADPGVVRDVDVREDLVQTSVQGGPGDDAPGKS